MSKLTDFSNPMDWRDRVGALNLPNRTPMPEWHDPDPEGKCAASARAEHELIERAKAEHLAFLEDFYQAITIELDNFDPQWQSNNRLNYQQGVADLAGRAVFHMGDALQKNRKLLNEVSNISSQRAEQRDHWRNEYENLRRRTWRGRFKRLFDFMFWSLPGGPR